MKSKFAWVLLLIGGIIFQEATAQEDNLIVSFDQFMQLVRQNHPLTRQGELIIESGEANRMRARGSFDPLLKSEFDQKQFDDKNYFQLNTNELKVPTPFALELKAGYDNNTGVFVNPEHQLPQAGLAYAGVAIPLVQGLLFDERRQAVRQAEVFQRGTVLEQTLLINQLEFDAAKAYWDWYNTWNTYEVFNEAVRLAQFRFEGVRESYIQGDLPAIDTLEAFILVQIREQSRYDALIHVQQAKLEASNYLWSENLDPLLLTETSMPFQTNNFQINDPAEANSVAEVLYEIERLHPKILLYYNKIENLDYERRLKVEKVKPKLNVNYNLLNEPVNGRPFENYSANNYKWGFDFAMPLLLRRERGDLQLTKIKISQTDLERQEETLKIVNKIKAYQVEINNLYQQIELYRATVANYLAMVEGEKIKFQEGESSLFLVNTRENSLIEAEVKLVDLIAKYQKAHAGLEMSIGGKDVLLLASTQANTQ